MKKFIFSLIAILTVTAAAAKQGADVDAMWDRANTLYINGDYNGAVEVYDSIAACGVVSSRLYYNLANAYFKNSKIAPAILNYNLALRLDPSDQDIVYNLAVANSYTKDSIEQVPDFFLNRWFGAAAQLAGCNGWAIVSLVLLALTFGFILVYLLCQKLAYRKTGFSLAIVAAMLFLLTMSFALFQRHTLLHGNEAIVFVSSLPVKSSPENGSKDLFILHEGTKVKVIRKMDSWSEIVIADGNKGWVRDKSIRRIDFNLTDK